MDVAPPETAVVHDRTGRTATVVLSRPAPGLVAFPMPDGWSAPSGGWRVVHVGSAVTLATACCGASARRSAAVLSAGIDWSTIGCGAGPDVRRAALQVVRDLAEVVRCAVCPQDDR